MTDTTTAEIPASLENVTAADLADAAYGAIQSIIEPGSPNNVAFHYFLPGIPFGPELASFMDVGQVPQDVEQTDAEGNVIFTGNDMMRAAVNFARMMDHVPATGETLTPTSGGEAGTVDLNALISSGNTVSGTYHAVLHHCQVVDNALSAEDQERLRKLRALLYEEVPDDSGEGEGGTVDELLDADAPLGAEIDLDALIGDGADVGDFGVDASAVPQPTRLMAAYEATRIAYEQVQSTELLRMQEAGTGPAAGAVIAAAQRRIDAAKRRWEVLGRKNRVERIQAAIAQLELGGMPMYVDNLRRVLDASRMDAAIIATDEGVAPIVESAYYTALRPNNVLRAATLMRVSMDSSLRRDWKSLRKSSTEGSGGGLFLGIALWGGGGKVSEDQERKFFSEGFSISFELVQGLVDRGQWFDLPFLTSRAYTTVNPEDTTEKLDPVHQIVQLSDGQRPPSGSMPLVPMTAYFVRNLTVRSRALLSLSDTEKDSISGGGGLTFLGMFGGGGQHTTTTTTVDTTRASRDGELTFTGMYLIALASRMMPLAPNPDFETWPSGDDWI